MNTMTVPVCPIGYKTANSVDHDLNNEPEGVWCEQCRKFYQWSELVEIEVDEEWA